MGERKMSVLPVDPFCDPENPVVVTFQDVSTAAYNIRGGIEKTPCKISHQLSRLTKTQIYLKKEMQMVTGSFKERGARNCLQRLPDAQKKIGVCAASAGNHALALAYHGQLLNIPVTVVMPTIAPLMKISMCRSYGATVVIHGNHILEAREKALGLVKQHNLIYINGFDHPDIIAGQGTMGLEIIDDVPDFDAIVIPIGGGGLIAGTALVIKHLFPHVKVIGVEAKTCPSFTRAVEEGKPVHVSVGSSISDGLSVPMVGGNAFKTVMAKGLIDKLVLVSEEYIALAILRLIEMEKSVVEGGGAVGLAAILEGLLPELEGKRVIVPLCGGNIDTTILGRCLDRGLAVDGRLCRFVVTVSDRPGGIADLTKTLAKLGASIKDIFHERAWLRTDVFSVRVRVTVETHDKEHGEQIERVLRTHYDEVYCNLSF